MTRNRVKHYIPLESNPQVFTDLIKSLGVSGLEFCDVYSIDAELLAMVPRPALALILVGPTSEANEKHKAEDEAKRSDYTGSGEAEDIIWYRQTIGNACGLYGILHALSNGSARNLISPSSKFGKLLETIIPLPPAERAKALEDSTDLEESHSAAARKGDSAVPASAEDDVDFHYVCLVPSKSNHVYELDGSRRGPVDTGIVLKEGEDVLGEGGLKWLQEYIDREEGSNVNFSLMALVPSQS